MVLQGSNYNIPLRLEDSLLTWISSLLFSSKDFTTRDGFCLSVSVLKMVVTSLDCYYLSKQCNENVILSP